MLIWLNGAFGSGKTTLADELALRLPSHVKYDPEFIGFAVREYVPPAQSGDFQDLPIWRHLVVSTVSGLRRFYPGPIITPMTLVVPDYVTEIFAGLRGTGEKLFHFWLDVSPDTLRSRIAEQVIEPNDKERDSRIREWRLGQVERCIQARPLLPPETVILDGDRSSPELLADMILETIKEHHEIDLR